jgi:hypothetical protein
MATKKKINDAKEQFHKNNDIKAFYNRIIQAATNTENKLFPSKVHAKDLSRYQTEDEYENSLQYAINFSNKFTEKQKKSFDTVIYHKSNSDGVVSAFIAWQYLTENGTKNKNIEFLKLNPDKSSGNKVSYNIQKILQKLKGKSVFMVDLFYNKTTYEAINDITTLFVSIDDHKSIDKSLENVPYRFSTEDNGKDNKHSAVAAVWKFFYPKERVPYFVQYVDAGDSSGHYKWLPEINNFMTVMAVRYVKNQKRPDYQKDPTIMFKDMNEFFKGRNATALNFLVVVGQIMNEIRENMKAEISSTAAQAKFILEGKTYPIMIINFSSPGLTKSVLKNVASRNPQAKFAIAWFYNYTAKLFDVSFSTDHMHNPGSVDVGIIAQKLGRILKGSSGGHKDFSRVTFRGSVGALDKFIRP